jgi:hypothetical protein
MDDTLTIPAFLRRTPATPNEPRLHLGEPQMSTTPARKPRLKIELPTSIDKGEGHVLLEAMTLVELVEEKTSYEKQLANIGKTKLELRAINAEIRKRAR